MLFCRFEVGFVSVWPVWLGYYGCISSFTRALILGVRPDNEIRRYKVTPSFRLGANLESALFINFPDFHDDIIKWKHFLRYWPFVQGIHRSPVNSRHKGQWRGALMFSLMCAWINDWVNNREAGDLRRQRAHCGVIVVFLCCLPPEAPL